MLKTHLFSFVFLLFFASTAFAQTGSITGTVTNESGDPVPTANVLLVEISRGAATNLEGEYTIEDVPAGTYTLRVTYVGYQEYRDQVTIEDGEELVKNVTLQTGAVGLQELVVTGIASERSRATAEVAVSRIDAVELTETVNYQNVSQLLGGKAAGVNVKRASGSVGSGFRFKIRAGGGLKGTGQPVIYIDGVRVNNAEVEGLGSGGQGYGVLSSLNPSNIESIDILKGPAAAALYGTSGSNGVVLITTKDGGGIPGQDIAVSVTSMLGFNEQLTPYTAHEYLTYQGANDEFIRGAIRENEISVSGGQEDIRYYTSIGHRYEEGILRNDDLGRFSLRANFEAFATENLSFDVNTNYSIIDRRIQLLDNAFGPLNNTLFITDQRLFSKTGSREAVYAFENFLETNRFIGSLDINWTPFSGFELQATVGYDGYNLKETQTQPVGFSYGGDTEGAREIYQRKNTQQNYNINARYRYQPLSNLSATTIVGMQLYNHQLYYLNLEKENFPAEPLMNIGAGEEFLGADEYALHERQAGLFISQQLAYDNTYFATLGLRRDYSSVVGIEAPSIFYPKVSVAVRLDQFDFMSDAIGLFKLRAAYGQSGQLPNLLDGARRLWGGSAFGYGTGAVLEVIGNSEIKPERVGQIEVGLDAEFSEKYSLSFSFYRTNASESIVNYQQSPSTGLTVDDIPFNVGKIKGWGLEGSLQVQLIQKQDMRLSTRLLWSYSENEVQSLGLAQPIFDRANVIKEGLPRAAWYPYQNNGALFNEDGTYAGADISFTERTFVGTPYPEHSGAFSVNFAFHDFTFYALTEWALGLHIYNNTGQIAERYGNYAKRLRMAARLGVDRFRDIWEEEFPGIEQLEPGTPEYREVANTYALLDPASAEGYIQAADYFGVSELSIGYNFTDLFSSLGPVRNVSLIASARNVFLFSLYEGPDPRVSWQGSRTIERGVDFTSLQHPRTFSLTLNLDF